MSPTSPTTLAVDPLLVQRAVEGLKDPVLVVNGAVPQATEPPYGAVVVAAPDLAALRILLRDLPDLGRSRMVAVVVAEGLAPLPVRLDPRWPALQDLDARLDSGAAVTVVRFTARVPVADVLAAIAYADRAPAHDGLLVARTSSPDDKVPPDVVTDQSDPAESPVLGRPPVAIGDPGPEPLDETLFNPIGFRRDWDRGVVDLDPAWTPTPGLVASLRDAQAVRVTEAGDERLVAALAMSGIPLVDGAGDDALDDSATRERHSVRQRRAALLEHSTFAWRRRLAERARTRIAEGPELVLVGGDDLDPDIRTDLELARRYSGADVVEVPTGAGHPGPTECFVTEPLGGPVLVERTLLDEAGGLDGLRSAGCTIYRIHAPLPNEEREAP